MTGSEHALYEELTAGYALSALEPDEELLFLHHLAGCARCELELAEHTAIASQLAYAVTDAAPTASLWVGIAAGIAASDRESTATASADASAHGSASQLATVTPLRRRWRPEHPGAWIGAAAAVALVATLGVSNVAMRSDRDSAQEASVRLRSAVSQIDNSRTVQLRATDGKVLAVALVSNNQVSLVLDGMARNNDQSSTYVLWRKGKYGSATAVGSFDVHDSKVDVVRNLPLQGAREVTLLAITLERGRVAPATAGSPMLAVGQLA